MKNSSGGLTKVQIWSIIVVLSVIFGLIGSCITIYEFPSFIRSEVSSSSTPTFGNSQQETGVVGVQQTPTQPLTLTQVLPTDTPIPSPTPSPTPTQPSPPKPGTVLYQANWSNGINGW